MFEWDSDKAEIVLRERKIKFYDVSSMLESEDTYYHISEEIRGGEERFKTFGLANNGEYYVCIYTKRKRKKRIITAWEAGSDRERRYSSLLLINNRDLVEHISHQILEQKLLKERKMKDWPDYPTDKEYWEKEMPDMKNLTRVIRGTMDQYLKQKKELGEKKFFKILRKKYGSIDVGNGQKMHDYYPITAEDIRKYG